VNVQTKIYVIPDSNVDDVFSKKHNNSPVSDEEIEVISSVAKEAIRSDVSTCCVIQ